MLKECQNVKKINLGSYQSQDFVFICSVCGGTYINKGKSFGIPKDSICPFSTYQVWECAKYECKKYK